MRETNFVFRTGHYRVVLALVFLLFVSVVKAQVTFPENGIADPRHGHYAFTNATIVKDATTTLTNATLVIKDGRISAIGTGLKVPAGAVEVDCKGKYIYPSFIDIYTDYGTPQRQQTAGGGGFNFNQAPQLETAVKGPYGWNQAIKSDVDVYKVFAVNDATAKTFREAGFGSVLTHVKDGVARGTGAVVTLANEKENLVIIKEKASAHYSFSKGTSGQSYPGSLMGSIALLRQTYLDADWYKTNPKDEGVPRTLRVEVMGLEPTTSTLRTLSTRSADVHVRVKEFDTSKAIFWTWESGLLTKKLAKTAGKTSMAWAKINGIMPVEFTLSGM